MATLAECRKLAKKVGWTIRVHKGLHKYTMHDESGSQVYWAANLDFLKQTIDLEISCWKDYGCSGKTTVTVMPKRKVMKK
jgi:hypothetical protein